MQGSTLQGCIEAEETYHPRSSKNTMSSGTKVFFIQKDKGSDFSKKKSMPFSNFCLCIKPYLFWSSVIAHSTSKRTSDPVGGRSTSGCSFALFCSMRGERYLRQITEANTTAIMMTKLNKNRLIHHVEKLPPPPDFWLQKYNFRPPNYLHPLREPVQRFPH